MVFSCDLTAKLHEKDVVIKKSISENFDDLAYFSHGRLLDNNIILFSNRRACCRVNYYLLIYIYINIRI